MLEGKVRSANVGSGDPCAFCAARLGVRLQMRPLAGTFFTSAGERLPALPG